MNTWRVILATMIIFGTGVVTGGLLVRFVEHNGAARPPRPGLAVKAAQSLSAGGMRYDFLRRVEKDLDLTAKQRERIDRILKEGQERNKKLMDPIAPKLRDELHRTREEFRAVLTPSQQVRFDALLKLQQRPREQRKQLPPRERPPQPPDTPAPIEP